MSIWVIVLLRLGSCCKEKDNMRKPLYTDELRAPHFVHSPQTSTRAHRSGGLEPAVGKIRVRGRAMYDGSQSTKNPPEVGSGAGKSGRWRATGMLRCVCAIVERGRGIGCGSAVEGVVGNVAHGT
jgi:hypothetical protein